MPTPAGGSIRAHVERVETEALSIQWRVAGQDVRLEGVVRVAGTQLLMSHLLAPSFAALQSIQRGIVIEAVPELPGELLATPAADLGVQLRRFEHHELWMRSIGRIAFGLYGCVSYIARHGEPDLGDGCAGHRLITLLDEQGPSGQAAWLAEHARRAEVVLRADSYETRHWAACCGGGLALLPRFRADAEPALRRIRTPAPVPSAEIWLGLHRENRKVPRVRTVLDVITDAARNRSAALNAPEMAEP